MDIAKFVHPPSLPRVGWPLLQARNRGTAIEYGVLARVFHGSGCSGESVDEYADLVRKQTRHIRQRPSGDTERLGFPQLTRGPNGGPAVDQRAEAVETRLRATVARRSGQCCSLGVPMSSLARGIGRSVCGRELTFQIVLMRPEETR